MSKQKTGLLIALGAAIGAAAAGISYYLKYKSFHDELNKDFHDYEEDDAEEETDEEVCNPEVSGRTYITLDSAKHKVCEPELTEEETEPTETEEKPAPAPSTIVEEDTEENAE